jgi:N-acetylglucosaminyldiphosphoundecaprenol N-acetyl-beta-D-mannosaminyltransferase
MKPLDKSVILGMPIHAQRFEDAIQTLVGWAAEPTGRYVCTCPVYTLMLTREQPELREAILKADMTTADGMPLVWVQRRRGFRQAERVYGPDILMALCQATAESGVRHFFLGGGLGVADALVRRLKTQFPALQVAGTLAPVIERIAVEPDIVEQVNAAQPHIVWVGLGSPKQDVWMAAHRSALPCLMIGVGAAFDMFAGRKRQAPRWLRRMSLEWVFRLIQEPRRLWRRYILYNPRFVFAILREEWRQAQERKVLG